MIGYFPYPLNYFPAGFPYFPAFVFTPPEPEPPSPPGPQVPPRKLANPQVQNPRCCVEVKRFVATVRYSIGQFAAEAQGESEYSLDHARTIARESAIAAAKLLAGV